jgi:hypothetical protein
VGERFQHERQHHADAGRNQDDREAACTSIAFLGRDRLIYAFLDGEQTLAALEPAEQIGVPRSRAGMTMSSVIIANELLPKLSRIEVITTSPVNGVPALRKH